MPNNNPVRTEEFKKYNYQSYGGDDLNVPLGEKVFGIKMPIDAEAMLLKMNPKERVAFMRSVLLKALRNRTSTQCPNEASQ